MGYLAHLTRIYSNVLEHRTTWLLSLSESGVSTGLPLYAGVKRCVLAAQL